MSINLFDRKLVSYPPLLYLMLFSNLKKKGYLILILKNISLSFTKYTPFLLQNESIIFFYKPARFCLFFKLLHEINAKCTVLGVCSTPSDLTNDLKSVYVVVNRHARLRHACEHTHAAMPC